MRGTRGAAETLDFAAKATGEAGRGAWEVERGWCGELQTATAGGESAEAEQGQRWGRRERERDGDGKKNSGGGYRGFEGTGGAAALRARDGEGHRSRS